MITNYNCMSVSADPDRQRPAHVIWHWPGWSPFSCACEREACAHVILLRSSLYLAQEKGPGTSTILP